MSISTILMLLGFLGIPALVVYFVAAVGGFGFLLGVLSFFRSPLGLIVLGGALYIGGNFVGYRSGYKAMEIRCDADKRASEAAAKRMDAEIAAKSAAERADQEKDEAARVAAFEERIRSYEQRLAASGGDRCIADDDDADDGGVRDDERSDLPSAAPLPSDRVVDRSAPLPRPRAPQRR